MKKNRSEVVKALAMVTQFGINMMVPIGLCVALGVWLGDNFDIDWIVIPLFFMGALAGYKNIMKMAQQFIKKDTKKERNAKKN